MEWLFFLGFVVAICGSVDMVISRKFNENVVIMVLGVLMVLLYGVLTL